jgi:protein O-GlcNAc transferase
VRKNRLPSTPHQVSPPPPSETAAAFSRALTSHQAGRLDEAEQLYRKILETQPLHFDSLHLLGVIHHQRGDDLEAVRHIDAALNVNSDHAGAHNNRGIALKALHRFSLALASYEWRLRSIPNSPRPIIIEAMS